GHTRLVSGWSSDVCSSDLAVMTADRAADLFDFHSFSAVAHLQFSRSAHETRPHSLCNRLTLGVLAPARLQGRDLDVAPRGHRARSEERRVGKGGRARAVRV